MLILTIFRGDLLSGMVLLFSRMMRRSGATLKTMGRDRKGTTAVEFALIATPLIALMLACLELSLYVIVNVSLDNATQTAAREIRMGIKTLGNSSAASFRQQVCDKMGWLGGDCMNNLKVDVDAYDNFALVSLQDPIQNGGFVNGDMGYDIGGASKIQLVRTYFSWTMVLPLLINKPTTLTDGKMVISSKVVFRNEPF